MKYTEQQIQQVIDAADIELVAGDHITDIRPQGTKRVSACPFCSAKRGKFYLYPDTNTYHCFVCDETGNVVQLIQRIHDISFLQAVENLAERFGVSLTPNTTSAEDNTYKRDLKMSFRDQQLLASGITQKAQQYTIRVKENQLEIRDRYEQATVITRGGKWDIVPGDDMVLHYIDLQGNPLLYHPSKGKPTPFIRVRWANPDLRKWKDGSAPKYLSPKGAGNHLWLPQTIIDTYKNAQRIRTLFVVEGEKKADSMCLNGMMAVGIAGIHNLAHEGAMPIDLQNIIRKCKVANVVMVYDSDWQDINAEPGKHVDRRPRSFAKAANTFIRYFRAFQKEGIDLEIFLTAHRDRSMKGIDDLLVRGMHDAEAGALLADFNTASEAAEQPGKGKYLDVYHVTQHSSSKVYDIWHLTGFAKFVQAHREELVAAKVFSYQNVERRYNDQLDDFELAQAIMPSEQYWYEIEKKSHTETSFHYERMFIFLRNHGFGRFKVREGAYRLVHQNGRVLSAIDTQHIRDYVLNFTRALENGSVLEMLHRGATQYLGPNNLGNMFQRTPQLLQPDPDAVYLAFAKTYWKITAEAISEGPIEDLPGYIWKDQIIDFEPTKLHKPLFTLSLRDNQPHLDLSKDFFKCDMARFCYLTSWEGWRQQYDRQKVDGRYQWIPKTDEPWKKVDATEIPALTLSLSAKLLATGYVLQPFRDYSMMKAIIAMDAKETEVGSSQGGTGKSLWSNSFKYLRQMVTIDGKKKNLTDDQFIYANVTERTGIIVIDDCRINFDFEHFFSQITQGITVNAKGEAPYDLLPPRFIFSTNHAMRGQGNSFERRQYYITFTDFFNGDRSPADEFGGQLFHDWEYDQWNYYYNFMASCIQAHLQHKLSFEVNLMPIRRRKIRQELGEDLLDWLTVMYSREEDENGNTGPLLNKQISIAYLYERCIQACPGQKKYINKTRLQSKLRLFAEYAGLDINPETGGKRMKSNTRYFIALTDDNYDSSKAKRHRIVDSDTYLQYTSALSESPF